MKVTSTIEGAMFDLNKGESLAFTNACCFEKEHSISVIAQVEEIRRILLPGTKLIKPTLDQWIYTVPIDLSELNRDDMMLAGEVEFYIYHAICLARMS